MTDMMALRPELAALMPEHLPAHWQQLTEECAVARAEAKEWKEIAIRAQALVKATRAQLYGALAIIDGAEERT